MQPLLQWKSIKCYIFWTCVCSLSYPACNALAPCRHLWPVRLYNIFPHYLTNGTFSKKKNVCFDFPYNFVRNISHSKKKWVRYDQKCILVFIYSTRYSCQIIVKFEFSRQFFEKYSNIKFHENSFSESRIVPCGRTDMAKLTVALRSFSNAPTNTLLHFTKSLVAEEGCFPLHHIIRISE